MKDLEMRLIDRGVLSEYSNVLAAGKLSLGFLIRIEELYIRLMDVLF